VAQRIDTVLDILVAGDYHSAIRNLEILKSELLAQNGAKLRLKTHSQSPVGSVITPFPTSFRFIKWML
jgi:hypothetical protein